MFSQAEFQKRILIADRVLTDCWGCEYWTRDEQMYAQAEGWALHVFELEEHLCDRINISSIPGMRSPFAYLEEAVAYVVQRAEEGSMLHMRAMVLHSASVLKYG